MTIEGFTIAEMAKILELKPITIKMRIRAAGIKPIEYVGRTAIYAPDTVEKIRYVKMGRPKKKPD